MAEKWIDSEDLLAEHLKDAQFRASISAIRLNRWTPVGQRCADPIACKVNCSAPNLSGGVTAMPIHSQHLPMSFEEWERLPRPPGWKYEYYDGCAHIRPTYQYAVAALAVGPRPVIAPCVLRPALAEDEATLLDVYLEAFDEDPVFCDYTEEEFVEAARADLRESFSGRRAP